MAQFCLSIFFGHSIGIAFRWLLVCWFNLFVLYRLISLSSSSSSSSFPVCLWHAIYLCCKCKKQFDKMEQKWRNCTQLHQIEGKPIVSVIIFSFSFAVVAFSFEHHYIRLCVWIMFFLSYTLSRSSCICQWNNHIVVCSCRSVYIIFSSYNNTVTRLSEPKTSRIILNAQNLFNQRIISILFSTSFFFSRIIPSSFCLISCT